MIINHQETSMEMLHFFIIFFSIPAVYRLIQILFSKKRLDNMAIFSISFCLFIIGLAIHYDRYPKDMFIETIIMALCYPVLGYLTLLDAKKKSNKNKDDNNGNI